MVSLVIFFAAFDPLYLSKFPFLPPFYVLTITRRNSALPLVGSHWGNICQTCSVTTSLWWKSSSLIWCNSLENIYVAKNPARQSISDRSHQTTTFEFNCISKRPAEGKSSPAIGGTQSEFTPNFKKQYENVFCKSHVIACESCDSNEIENKRFEDWHIKNLAYCILLEIR